MTANEKVAVDFYEAFRRLDAEAMAAQYSDNILFSDPVFPDLRGEAARNMWRMLCKRAPTLKVEYRLLTSQGNTVSVYWDAYYPFSKTGRTVHNQVTATLQIENGKIVRHTDQFDFWRWSRQALGLPGLLLGWTPLIKGKVRAEAQKGLRAFQA